jgi:hypothetical protein
MDIFEALGRVPALLKSIDKVATLVAEGGGLPLHRDSLASIARRSAIELLGLPLWIIALALAAIALKLW